MQLEHPLTVATQCSEFFTFSTSGLTSPEYFALKKKEMFLLVLAKKHFNT